MTVYELTRAQLDELKEHYAVEIADDDPDWFNEHDGYEIFDHDVFEHYEGFDFGNDDFWCTAGMDDDEVRYTPINDFLEHLKHEWKFYNVLNDDVIFEVFYRMIGYVVDTSIKNGGSEYTIISTLAGLLDVDDSEIERHLDVEALMYNLKEKAA